MVTKAHVKPRNQGLNWKLFVVTVVDQSSTTGDLSGEVAKVSLGGF